MRLTIIIILVAVFQLSAKNTRGQTLTYNKKEVSISKLFMEIKKQTGYNVVWSDRWLSPHMMVNVDFYNTPLAKVFDKILFGRSVTYEFVGKAVVIKIDHRSLIEQGIGVFAGIDVHGRVVGENNVPLEGATVKVKGTKTTVMTDKKGEFLLKGLDGDAVLVISFLGYESKEVKASKDLGNIRMVSSNDKLEEVQIVSTGYQEIPKERATGSFTTINNKTINRSVGINVLDRLEGVASGLLLNRGSDGGNNPKISIHGRSTLFAQAEPLLVLNGFPFDGKIDQINPADIETITLLKDAAASSIWGVRSGNGVIVITTKNGRKNQPLTVEVNSTLTISDKPDLYNDPQLSSSEFIDLEQFLFSKGFYNSRFSNPYNAVSPAVEIFNQRKLKKISSADSALQIYALKSHDVRYDIDKYLYRAKVQKQVQLNIRGGSNNHQYYISGGYDDNLENKIADSYNRVTLTVNNGFSFLKDKLTLSTEIGYGGSKNASGYSYNPYVPYEAIADENGNSLPTVLRSSGFRMSYIDTAGKGKLLDWHYRPKDEMQNSVRNLDINQYRIKAGLTYSILKGLNVIANYQYLNELQNSELDQDQNTFYARDLINKYSSISSNGVTRVIPLGSIFTVDNSALISKIFRGQFNLNKTFGQVHIINAIAGYEGRDARLNRNSIPYYGYDSETKTNSNATINPLNDYKLYYGSGFDRIPTSASSSGTIDINQSFYINSSYSYKDLYILSGSARRDESNLFGVKTNQKGVPLWSVGLAWNISQENFYKINWLPILKVRATYGSNGNVDKSVSAYLTSMNAGIPGLNGDPTADIRNAPNPSLRWEKVKTWNFGIDFTFKDNRVSGSLDVYKKNAFDLIGNNPIAFQSGISQFRGNGADLETKGIDLILSSRNLTGKLSWNTTFLFNYNTDKVTSYKVKQPSNVSIVSGNYNNPLEGYPYNAVFSFPSEGLDAGGDPQGYYNGSISKDYTKILSILDPSQLKYHGSSSPKYFGSLINTFNYQGFELSFNITYKFDYYIRRLGVFSGSNYGSATNIQFKLSDYEKRWQKAGDELTTRIPSLVYPNSAERSNFFLNSEDVIEKGDHIRLQDIRFSYNIPSVKTLFKNINMFFYARNIGVLWRENKLGIDPDYPSLALRQSLSGSIGLNFTL